WCAGRPCGRHGRGPRRELGMDRQRRRGAGLSLFDVQEIPADMLAAHADNVAAPLSGIEAERKGQPLARADHMRRLELRELLLIPCVVTGAAHAPQPNPKRRIVVDELELYAMLRQR